MIDEATPIDNMSIEDQNSQMTITSQSSSKAPMKETMYDLIASIEKENLAIDLIIIIITISPMYQCQMIHLKMMMMIQMMLFMVLAFN